MRRYAILLVIVVLLLTSFNAFAQGNEFTGLFDLKGI